MHKKVRSHIGKEWGISKAKRQGGYLLEVRQQQCARITGVVALQAWPANNKRLGKVGLVEKQLPRCRSK